MYNFCYDMLQIFGAVCMLCSLSCHVVVQLQAAADPEASLLHNVITDFDRQ